MKYNITTLLLLLTINFGIAQQETIMTKYTFNSLFFNPAYAGSHGEGIGTATVQYRNQWLGVKGAPTTMLASGEISLAQNRLGVGATLGRETIGSYSRAEFSLNSAYRIQVGEGHLSGGIKTSFFNFNSDFTKLSILDGGDPAYSADLTSLNFFGVGMGVYYHDDNLFLSMSVPTIVSIGAEDNPIKRNRHIFMHMGLMIGDEYSTIRWQPSILVKYQPAVPLQMTMSVSAWLRENFSVGAHWRYNDALALSIEFHFLDNWKISTAYDLTISDLNDYSSGSPEVMLGYRFSNSRRHYNSSKSNWYY